METPNRKPDVETPTFKLWMENLPPDEKRELPYALKVEVDKQEEFYEQRVYRSEIGYLLFIRTKSRPDGMMFYILKVKRPNGTDCIFSGPKGWLSKEDYLKHLNNLENSELQMLYDMKHPEITEGRKINLYVKAAAKEAG